MEPVRYDLPQSDIPDQPGHNVQADLPAACRR